MFIDFITPTRVISSYKLLNSPVGVVTRQKCRKCWGIALKAGGKTLYQQDGKEIPKIHPAQKPVKLLKQLIEIFTDPGDVVIDHCFGSGGTGRACLETGRNFYGFEINKEFYKRAKEEMCVLPEHPPAEVKEYQQLSLFQFMEAQQ